MATYDNAYSRFIAAAKIVLPLAALALLSTLFLFSRNTDPNRAIPYAQVDVEKLAREQRISAPHYTGVTGDGTAISLAAEQATPRDGAPDEATATGLLARLDFEGGTHADIIAAEGRIDAGENLATLGGGVTIDTSTGYHVETERLRTALDRTSVITETPVSAIAPMGELTAGRMELTDGDGENGGYVLVFKDGVKLIYQPEN